MSGLASGLGAATADAVYGCIAAFGLTVISSIFVSQQIWLRFVGGVFLCYLGFRIFMSRPAERGISAKGNSLIGAYTSTFFLTITNPMTILSFAAIFAGLGLANSESYISAGMLVLGVFTGSALWWLILSSAVGMSRKKFDHHWAAINRISGMVITGFGLLALSLRG